MNEGRGLLRKGRPINTGRHFNHFKWEAKMDSAAADAAAAAAAAAAVAAAAGF